MRLKSSKAVKSCVKNHTELANYVTKPATLSLSHSLFLFFCFALRLTFRVDAFVSLCLSRRSLSLYLFLSLSCVCLCLVGVRVGGDRSEKNERMVAPANFRKPPHTRAVSVTNERREDASLSNSLSNRLAVIRFHVD